MCGRCHSAGCLALAPAWSKRMCVASLSAAVTVGGKVKAMKCLGSNRAWLKQSPWPGQEANFMQLSREDEGREREEWGAGGSFMNSEYPTTQLHHTAICPQQPINWWKGQRVISYLTWQLLMCSEVKHLKWRMGETSEQLQTPVFYRYGFKTSDLMDCAELFFFFF